MTFIDTVHQLLDGGYYCYPVVVRLDEQGKKRPVFPGSWTNSSRSLEPGDFDEGTPGLVIDTEKSDIIVIDVDIHGSVNGRTNLEAAGIAIPETPMTVRTRSGGQHLYFRQPDVRIPCYQGVPVPAVDVRGLGGVVFGPGTIIRDHEGYFAGGYTPYRRIIPVSELPVLPPEFIAAIAAATRKPERSESRLEPFRGELSDHQARVLEGWLDDDLETVAHAGNGERHGVLLQHAKKIIDRATKLGYSTEDAIELIHNAYDASGGSEWSEKRKVLDWVIDRLEDDPLGVPENPPDDDDVRFEEAVRERLVKIRVENEAKKRAAQDRDPVDLGRELDFDEPPDGLFGKSWVDGVLPKGETVLLFGERNVGKSFIAIDLGLSVATGRPWHGRKTQAGRVLYLAGEGAIGLPSRRRSWVTHHGVAAPSDFVLRDAIVYLNNPGSMAAWQKVIAEQEIDLVILDTLRRAGRGREMENAGDAQELVELMDDLRSVRHGCTVLALGHPTKSEPLQPAGAGTVQDSLPMIHRVARDGFGETTVVDMVTTKSKDGPTGHLASFTHCPVGDSLVFLDYGPAMTAGDRRRDEEEGLMNR